ncbi:MAG: bifunctional hydroxymethylpyrimidine kinase/phosphomethylpyrimidine kinase [Lachnospirales bacterium]
MKKVLTIAGSDCSGGAGIQADLKTITAYGLYAMSAITALTAQNTTGVYGVLNCDGEFLANQLDCIFKDIFPDAVKIGMVSSTELINVISDKIMEYKPKNIVLDTVMVSTSGSPLLEEDAKSALISRLIPLADIITPNIPETEVLFESKVKNLEDMRLAANTLGEKFGCSVLVKGGHLIETATDVLYNKNDKKVYVFKGERVDNPNSHGTGCTLSSAIACNLALGNNLNYSIENAKKYLTKALSYGLDLGKGSGPVNHCFNIKGGF